jgi:hypothetical protein
MTYVPGWFSQKIGYPKYRIKTVYKTNGNVDYYAVQVMRELFGIWWTEDYTSTEHDAEKRIFGMREKYESALKEHLSRKKELKPTYRRVPPYLFLDKDKKSS